MKTLLTLILLSFVNIVYSQSFYFDPTVTTAIISTGSSTNSGINNNKKELSKIKEAQQFVNAQLVQANEYNKKLLNGLSEVSSAVRDSYTLKQCYVRIKNITNGISELLKYGSEAPQYYYFIQDYTKEVKDYCNYLYIDISRLLIGGTDNLMNSGQRRILIDDIYMRIVLIDNSISLMKYRMEYAKRYGFFKTMFQGSDIWVDDRGIMKNILRDIKYF